MLGHIQETREQINKQHEEWRQSMRERQSQREHNHQQYSYLSQSERITRIKDLIEQVKEKVKGSAHKKEDGSNYFTPSQTSQLKEGLDSIRSHLLSEKKAEKEISLMFEKHDYYTP